MNNINNMNNRKLLTKCFTGNIFDVFKVPFMQIGIIAGSASTQTFIVFVDWAWKYVLDGEIADLNVHVVVVIGLTGSFLRQPYICFGHFRSVEVASLLLLPSTGNFLSSFKRCEPRSIHNMKISSEISLLAIANVRQLNFSDGPE